MKQLFNLLESNPNGNFNAEFYVTGEKNGDAVIFIKFQGNHYLLTRNVNYITVCLKGRYGQKREEEYYLTCEGKRVLKPFEIKFVPQELKKNEYNGKLYEKAVKRYWEAESDHL